MRVRSKWLIWRKKMLNFNKHSDDQFSTGLYDEKTFYTRFTRDLSNARQEVIIESPFISTKRAIHLYSTLERLVSRKIKVWIITRQPKLHDEPFASQSEDVIGQFEQMGINVLVTKNNHHRKLAIIDRDILWEGSLNILSQGHSREIMRRLQGADHAKQMFGFLKLGKFIN